MCCSFTNDADVNLVPVFILVHVPNISFPHSLQSCVKRYVSKRSQNFTTDHSFGSKCHREMLLKLYLYDCNHIVPRNSKENRCVLNLHIYGYEENISSK